MIKKKKHKIHTFSFVWTSLVHLYKKWFKWKSSISDFKKIVYVLFWKQRFEIGRRRSHCIAQNSFPGQKSFKWVAGAYNLYTQAESFYFRPTRSNLLVCFDIQLKHNQFICIVSRNQKERVQFISFYYAFLRLILKYFLRDNLSNVTISFVANFCRTEWKIKTGMEAT